MFDNEKETSQICQELGLRHIPEIARNEFGTPLVSDLFEKAQRLANYDLICYINSDIIVTQDLIKATDILYRLLPRFVIVCSTWDLCIENEINFASSDWEEQLRDLVQEKGTAPVSIGMDLFLFPRGFYQRISPFAIGRFYWDNWLIFKARSEKTPLIDTSQFMLAVHQGHEKSTHSGRYRYPQESEEIRINQHLAGWWGGSFIGLDATHVLEKDGRLRKKPLLEVLQPRIKFTSSYYSIKKLWQGIRYIQRKLFSIKK